MPSRLANAVRVARARRSWTRETLAHESGLSWAAITQIESGRRTEVRVSSLVALARALGVSVDYLVRADVSPLMLEHRACLFSSPRELAEVVDPIVAGGVKAGHAVLVVTTTPNVAAIKRKLGAQSKHVEFGDSAEWYRTPAHATARYEAFARSALADGTQWVDLLGEPVWAGRNRAETLTWTRYESLLNIVFASWPATVNCLYDVPTLPKSVVATVERTHPELLASGGRRDSASYEDPIQFVTG